MNFSNARKNDGLNKSFIQWRPSISIQSLHNRLPFEASFLQMFFSVNHVHITQSLEQGQIIQPTDLNNMHGKIIDHIYVCLNKDCLEISLIHLSILVLRHLILQGSICDQFAIATRVISLDLYDSFLNFEKLELNWSSILSMGFHWYSIPMAYTT